MKQIATALFSFCLTLTLLHGQEFPQIQQLISGGRLDEAERQIEEGLKRFPRHPELLYWKSALQWEKGRGAEAIETLQGVLESGYAGPPHYDLLGHIYQSRQEWDQAVRVYSEALGKAKRPQWALNLAYAQFKSGRFDEAIATLGPFADGANPRALHLAGLSYFALKNLGDAASSLEQAIRLDPSDPMVHYDLGLVYLQTERFQAAADQFRQATVLKPDWADAQLYLGRALHDANLADDALAAFQAAQSLDPNLSLLHHHFGLLHKGRGEYDKAVGEFERELAAGTQYAATYYQLAEILYNRGEKERSSQLLSRAIELEPDNAEYRLQACKQALAARQHETAAAHLERALALDPQSSSGYYLKGRLLQAQGNIDEAKAAFEQSRRLADRKSRRATP